MLICLFKMEFVDQLRAHRQRAREDWARDQFFAATSDRRNSSSKISLPARLARFVKIFFNFQSFLICLVLGLILHFLEISTWFQIPVFCLAFLILIRVVYVKLRFFKKSERLVEMVDYRQVSFFGNSNIVNSGLDSKASEKLV